MASILVVGPHPDDQELGMGGAIATFVRQGHRVHLLDATNGEPTPRGSVETRAREAAEAAAVLGVTRSLVGFTNRQVVHNIESRHRMATEYRRHRPDIIFLPYPTDAHPDHVAVTRIGEDARFDAKLTKTDIVGEPWYPPRIIYYFATHLLLSFQPTFVLDVTDAMETKLKACACYKSQFGPDGLPEQVRQTSAYFGNRIRRPYAEPFYTHEVLGLSGIDQLTLETTTPRSKT